MIQAPFDKVEPLVYKYSASLMAADPWGTIETWSVNIFAGSLPLLLATARVQGSSDRRAVFHPLFFSSRRCFFFPPLFFSVFVGLFHSVQFRFFSFMPSSFFFIISHYVSFRCRFIAVSSPFRCRFIPLRFFKCRSSFLPGCPNRSSSPRS